LAGPARPCQFYDNIWENRVTSYGVGGSHLNYSLFTSKF
jgi:hypothetical protein